MKLPAFFRKSPVLCISAAFTLLSMLWVPPDRGYLDYLDSVSYTHLDVYKRQTVSCLFRYGSNRSPSQIIPCISARS